MGQLKYRLYTLSGEDDGELIVKELAVLTICGVYSQIFLFKQPL